MRSTEFTAFDPRTGLALEGKYCDASAEEIDAAVLSAARAFPTYRALSPGARAAFLDAIASELAAMGEGKAPLVTRCCAETGLPEARIRGELTRTVNQLKLFADLLRDGSWVEARIDRADPARKPAPKPDLRSMLRPLGPVAVFGASNFPLAFSVAGGDTASALAAGCPVVVKAHPAHPGTCDIVAEAISTAAQSTDMPEGVFSMVHGIGTEVGMRLVEHPAICAVGFTGSYRGGKALFDAAARRPNPIPVYAEMGSSNPVFILPGALGLGDLPQGLAASISLGTGQFCTNPGLLFLVDGPETKQFLTSLAEALKNSGSAPMLTQGIQQQYFAGIQGRIATEGVSAVLQPQILPSGGAYTGAPSLLDVSWADFESSPDLEEEVFGPAGLAVLLPAVKDFETVAARLHGHLTATIWGNQEDLKGASVLVRVLEEKVGRVIVNGFPTGVEVGHAMVHGGPFPATTDSRSTSVGTRAIQRFARPVCFQNLPQALLPPELQDANPDRIWRLVDGNLSDADI